MSGTRADDMASKILADAFQHPGRPATDASDPIVDTPMLVTLDQLVAYDHNPRVRKNPLYDELRASIRERGLDTPPAITRRPGEINYIIRNGGNTRLSILRELWSETRDERFYRIHCLFRPWTVRGEITVLTGHLAENELHGRLSFIERALGVERARELYEQESQAPLSQSELARRLSADGFPVQQSHISRMRDAIQHLLPAIPTVLYGGLGRHQVERLAVLRKAAERGWDQWAGEQDKGTFGDLFHDALSMFDGATEQFLIQRFRDELIGQMSERLGLDYAKLSLEVRDLEGRQPTPTHESSAASTARKPARTEAAVEPAVRPANPAQESGTSEAPRSERAPPVSPAPAPPSPDTDASPTTRRVADEATTNASSNAPARIESDQPDPRVQAHIASAAPTTERLQAIQKLVADHLDAEQLPDFEQRAVQAIPVQAGGLYPISDVWYIEPSLDTPEHLRIHIAQLAHEIADESGQANRISTSKTGLGYCCARLATPPSDPSSLPVGAGIATVLAQLADSQGATAMAEVEREGTDLHSPSIGTLLIGPPTRRISDTAVVKLFRLIRLGRRLLDLTSTG